MTAPLSMVSRHGLLLAEALLVCSGLAGLPSCAEARAVAAAGRIDQVHLGFGLDLEGRVSAGCTASTFALRDPIHLSLLVTDAAAGSVVRVAVRDAVTHRIAWSENRPVPPGRSYATFEIGRGLAEGRYRAESALGDATASPQDFAVHVWNGNGGGDSVGLDPMGRAGPMPYLSRRHARLLP